MADDVPEDEKKRRLELLDELQARVVAEINGRFLGQTVPVLVEDQHKGKWRGRTPQNKLVFFEDAARLARQDGRRRDHVDGSLEYAGAAAVGQPVDDPLVVFAG